MVSTSKDDQTFGDIISSNKQINSISNEKNKITLRTSRSSTDIFLGSKTLKDKSSNTPNLRFRLLNQYNSPSVSPVRESSPCFTDAVSQITIGSRHDIKNILRSPSFVSKLGEKSPNLIQLGRCKSKFELEIELKRSHETIKKLEEELSRYKEESKYKTHLCKICRCKIKDFEYQDIDKIIDDKLAKIKSQYEEDLEFEKQELQVKFECKLESLLNQNGKGDRNTLDNFDAFDKPKFSTLIIPNFISNLSKEQSCKTIFQKSPRITEDDCNIDIDLSVSDHAKKIINHYKKLLNIEREKLFNKMVEIESRMSKSLSKKDQQIDELKSMIKMYKLKYCKYKKLAVLQHPS